MVREINELTGENLTEVVPHSGILLSRFYQPEVSLTLVRESQITRFLNQCRHRHGDRNGKSAFALPGRHIG